MTVRRAHDGVRVRSQFTPVGPSKTKQSFAKEADINFIMARYSKTGVVTSMARGTPLYRDVSDAAANLHDAFLLVSDAEEQFMSLPSAVRRLANNDPVQLVAMLQDERAVHDLVDAGLDVELLAEPEEAPPEAPASAPEAPASPPEPTG